MSTEAPQKPQAQARTHPPAKPKEPEAEPGAETTPERKLDESEAGGRFIVGGVLVNARGEKIK